jgi:HEAT repeat protein
MLFRISGQKVQKIRMLAPDCLLDAGGLPFTWFNNVRPAESVALFEGMVKEQVGNAIYAIAVTKDPAADAALNRLVDPSQPENVRRSAMNWVGFDTLMSLLKNDASEKIRERAVDVLARRKEPQAIPTVIRAAREDKSDKVRRQAMNALARSKDPAALRFFEDVLVK